MNDINELLQIISSLGDEATSNDVVNEYCRLHHMIVQPQYKSIVENTLSKNKKLLRRNRATNAWELAPKDKADYLTVSDNKYFRTIRDAMLQIFNKSVPLSQGYFKVDDEHMAWFPQPKNENWENILSEDGKNWYEKPKTSDADYEADNKLRYIFIHEEGGYRFTGLFKVGEMAEDKTRVYELIDDKVAIIKPRPYLLICRVAYMKLYDGITEDDIPNNGGDFVDKNNDAHEKYNFRRYDDGNCYIFVETKSKKNHTTDEIISQKIHIEKINPLYKNKSSIDGVRVVLAALSPILNKTVVVGWYDNVTVYRNREHYKDKEYMMKCAFDDAHLIPENERCFEVPGGRGNEYGMGQSNYWYIQKNEAARDYESKLIDYINDLQL